MRKKEAQPIRILLIRITKIKYLFLFLFLFNCVNYAEREIIYLPEKYSGTVAIIFNQQDGTHKEYLKKSRIYRITNKGTIFTQFSKPDINSYLNQKIYYVDNKNKVLNEIDDFSSSNHTHSFDNKTYKFNMFNISIKNKNTLEKDDYIRCMYFSVGKINEKDSLIRVSHKKMEKLMRKLGEG